MRRDARRREPPGDQPHVLAQFVGGAQVDEAALDRRLTEEHRGCGRGARHLAELRDDLRVQPREAVDRAAPGHLHLAIGGLELRGRERERAILHHQTTAEHRCQHRRAGGHAKRDQERPLAARREARPDEAKREGDASQRHRYSHGTGV